MVCIQMEKQEHGKTSMENQEHGKTGEVME